MSFFFFFFFSGTYSFAAFQGWNAVIETNLTGTFLMSREVYRQYFNQHGGAIVNIIADMFRGFPLMAHTGTRMYCSMDGFRELRYIFMIAPDVLILYFVENTYRGTIRTGNTDIEKLF
jgi:hypothetical protein